MSDITPSSNGVWIPMSLAIPMMECYFGDGPRSRGRSDGTLPPKPEVPLPSPVIPIPAPQVSVGSPLPGYTPRGAAARAYAPASSPKHPASEPPPQPQREGDGVAHAG